MIPWLVLSSSTFYAWCQTWFVGHLEARQQSSHPHCPWLLFYADLLHVEWISQPAMHQRGSNKVRNQKLKMSSTHMIRCTPWTDLTINSDVPALHATLLTIISWTQNASKRLVQDKHWDQAFQAWLHPSQQRMSRFSPRCTGLTHYSVLGVLKDAKFLSKKIFVNVMPNWVGKEILNGMSRWEEMIILVEQCSG